MKKTIQKILAVMLSVIVAFGGINALAAESDITTVYVDVTYKQTNARSMLDMINEFRTGEDAWYWNSDDTTKTTLTDLSGLTYDYALEEIAMQRAAEIALSFSHTRTDGTTCFTASATDGTRTWAENIAAGYSTAQAAFTAWQETSSYYSGQGHRRSMLSADYTAIGIACVEYQGTYYWVQEFGYSASSTAVTTANDSATTVSVEVSASRVSSVTFGNANDLTMELGESADSPTVSATLTLEDRFPTTAASVTVILDWSSDSEEIATVSDGTIIANSVGETMLTASALGESLTLAVTVTPVSLSGATVTLSQDTYSYTGEANTPEVTVTLNGVTLVEGTDYTVSYSDNTAVGTATVTITGMGNYTDTATTEFTIVPCVHEYDVSTTAPTCTEDGESVYTCGNCGETYTEVIPATHSWDAGTVTTEATCTEEGVLTYTCTVCGEAETEAISALGHSFESEVTTEATCTEDGELLYTCSNCGETYTEVIPAAHSWDEGTVTTEATCTEDGVMTYTCTVCGETETGIIIAMGHSWDEGTVTKEATCIEDGVMTYACTVCGETETAIITAVGHSWDDGTVTTDATCTEDGEILYTCTVCGETKTESLSALGHAAGDAVAEHEIAATETEDGSYDRVVYCTVCGEELSRETITVLATGSVDVTPVIVAMEETNGVATGDQSSVILFSLTGSAVLLGLLTSLSGRRRKQ